MILEVAILNVRPGQSRAFEKAFAGAQGILASMTGYVSHQLRRSTDAPDRYVLLVDWERLEDHTVGFRQSPSYQEWRRLLHHFYEPFPTVEHYEPLYGREDARAATSPLDRAVVAAASLAVVSLGLAAGAMLTEAAVLVPYWRSLAAEEFLVWFGANATRLFEFFGPMEIASTAVTLVAATLYGVRRRAGARLLALAALLAIVVLTLYPLYFRDVNASFVARSIAPSAVAGELARWATWHWLRTVLGIGAFGAALAALRPAKS